MIIDSEEALNTARKRRVTEDLGLGFLNVKLARYALHKAATEAIGSAVVRCVSICDRDIV